MIPSLKERIMALIFADLADRRGAAVVEFALVLPLLAYLLFGILSYGQYFMLAHSLQQLANDAARATVAGLNGTERSTLAQQAVAAELPALTDLNSSRVSASTTEASGYVTVTLRYDASYIAIFRTGLIPMPGTMIERHAVARTGGMA
jgi:Flp pilus assembly protein TadG